MRLLTLILDNTDYIASYRYRLGLSSVKIGHFRPRDKNSALPISAEKTLGHSAPENSPLIKRSSK